MGRKSLNLTPEEIRERKRNWEKNNPEKVREYRRKGLITQCIKRGSMPCKATIERYGFTEEELHPIFASLFGREQPSMSAEELS
tara:strand:+ start:1324 stop:1575 length:252 start_codon:yes stop_codon:yes gene_type:complete